MTATTPASRRPAARLWAARLAASMLAAAILGGCGGGKIHQAPPGPSAEGADGEVLLKGPQVTHGYLDRATPQPFEDGYFLTGDLGYLTEEGSLVLHGRKKELIVTSYGKNIHPVKIESMLRDVAGVDEAMVVGDERPFCSAMIWVGCEDDDPALVTTIAEAIDRMNTKLSHPEQLKRWAVLKNDLSIECGDLTASLKLKRREVSDRYADVVEALYGGPEPTTEGVIRIGGGEQAG